MSWVLVLFLACDATPIVIERVDDRNEAVQSYLAVGCVVAYRKEPCENCAFTPDEYFFACTPEQAMRMRQVKDQYGYLNYDVVRP